MEGYTLTPSEQRKQFEGIQLGYKQKVERLNKKADEFIDVALKGLAASEHAAEAALFGVANRVFIEAADCLRHGCFEATMIMTRNTLDSALYASRYSKITSIKVDYVDGKAIGGTSEFGSPLSVAEKRVIWEDLEGELERLGFDEQEIVLVNKIRELGHFSAHIAEKQREALKEYVDMSEQEREKVRQELGGPKAFS